MQKVVNFNDVPIATVNKHDNSFFVYEQRWSPKFIKTCWFDWIKQNIINIKIYLLSYIKVGKETITFGDIEIEKKNFFTARKLPFFIRFRH